MGKLVLFCLMMAAVFAEKVTYQFSDELIDVVIPCGKKDVPTLELCIEGIRANVAHLGRVIVVAKERYTESAEWFDEADYPFTKQDLIRAILGKEESPLKSGWIYQQFLKLYAPFVIPNISSNVLIVDADVIFFRPVKFLGADYEGLYSHGIEHTKTYFEHMARLLPGLTRKFPRLSGISHHMLFQKPVLDDLFNQIETHHNEIAWKAICHSIDASQLDGFCLSEYEIYFNFVFSRTDQVKIRPLKWANKGNFSKKSRRKDKQHGYDFVAYHSYNRG